MICLLHYPNGALLLAAHVGKGDARFYVNVRNNISGEVAGAKSRRMREMPVLMPNLFPLADGVVAVFGGVVADTERLMDMPAGRVIAIFNPGYRPPILLGRVHVRTPVINAHLLFSLLIITNH